MIASCLGVFDDDFYVARRVDRVCVFPRKVVVLVVRGAHLGNFELYRLEDDGIARPCPTLYRSPASIPLSLWDRLSTLEPMLWYGMSFMVIDARV